MLDIYNISKKEKCYALFGNLLGDGSYSKGIIRCIHTNKQREYVKWLARLYRKWDISLSSRYDYRCKTTFGICTYSHVYCKVPSRKYFEENNRFFNEEGKKIISKYVLKRINKIGLLLWYLDDGCLSVHKHYYNKDKSLYSVNRAAYLNTQGFTLDENKLIQHYFDKRFDIQLKIHKDVNSRNNRIKPGTIYFRLYFNATNFRKFYDLLRPYLKYIPKSMAYKFNMQYKINRLKNSAYLMENYNMNNI